VAQHPPATLIAMVAVIAARFIMSWLTFTRIKTHIQNAATAATECGSGITMAGQPLGGSQAVPDQYVAPQNKSKGVPHRHQYGKRESPRKIHRIHRG
jgi:hypothetical protein